MILFLLLIILLVTSCIEYDYDLYNVSTKIDNPIIILFSFVIVYIFLQCKFHSKFVNSMAAASFTCFIFHLPFLRYVGVQKIMNISDGLVIVHMIVVSVLLYLISFGVYVVYSKIIGLIQQFFLKCKSDSNE